MSDLHNPNSTQRLKRLNHRQRKKMRVGEYRELGFHLIATIAADVNTDSLLDDWLNCIDDAAISFGGHFDGKSRRQVDEFRKWAKKVNFVGQAQTVAGGLFRDGTFCGVPVILKDL